MGTYFSDDIKNLASHLPNLPGVYQYFDNSGKIIYVGKAKDLRKRVLSYFTKIHDNRKTNILVKQIADIKHIVVETEEDALLLENNLIKKYQPKYNVLLKDDKSFPWICVKNEPFPRVMYLRNIVKDGSQYFGPYTSVPMVRTILDVIRHLFPIRNCNLNLSKSNIERKTYQVCLEYQIGNCLGPCQSLQKEDDYNSNILHIKEILKGNLTSVVNHLRLKMNTLAGDYKFEEAEIIKNKISILEHYKSKSTIVSSSITNVDVFSFDEDENNAYINFLRVVDGAIIQSHTLEFKKRLKESKEDLLSLGIIEIRQKFHLTTNEILVPFSFGFQLKDIKVIIPKIGDKFKLLELSQRNVKFYKLERNKELSLRNPTERTDRILNKLKSDLRLDVIPRRIECFDNSNIQGAQPVAACVVFIDGKPAKREYRHFNVKTVDGPNDFATMEEIIYRRYFRVVSEKGQLPDLIIVDGGKGQLTSAVNTLRKLGLYGSIAIIGIAKRLEEIIYPEDPVPLYLDKNSESLRIIQHLRNEAHRFGITFHRNKRSKEFIANELTLIPGIGNKTADTLMKKFKSVAQLKSTSLTEISKEIGIGKANLIVNYFNLKNSTS